MPEPSESMPRTIEARFRRTALTRVAKVDGAWGGLTPAGEILMALYSERLSLPESISYRVVEPDQIVQQSGDVQAPAIVRDVEIEAIMSISVAESLLSWLTEKIAEGKKHVPTFDPPAAI